MAKLRVSVALRSHTGGDQAEHRQSPDVTSGDWRHKEVRTSQGPTSPRHKGTLATPAQETMLFASASSLEIKDIRLECLFSSNKLARLKLTCCL